MSGERGDKSERLLNLTLALIATKKPMSKQQIFDKVSGYHGTPDAMERMFERDKDELRELGVNIEVLPIDPYFEDELGYRIIPQEFFLPDISFTSEETLWLAMAAHLIQEVKQSTLAATGLQKLLGQTAVDIEELIATTDSLRFNLPLELPIDVLWRAIYEQIALSFSYNTGINNSQRIISPYAIVSRHGIWYLVANDHKDDRVKTFRLDRISFIDKVPGVFQSKSEDFDLQSFIRDFHGERVARVSALAREKISQEHPLVRMATRSNPSAEVEPGDQLLFKRVDRMELKEKILWAGAKIEIVEPEDFRKEIIESLLEVIRSNR